LITGRTNEKPTAPAGGWVIGVQDSV
jgi:hypothetical protein